MQVHLTSDDKLEILERLSLYGMKIDDRDWPGLKEIFTTDAVFDVSDVGLDPADGLNSIIAMMESVHHPLAHLITNSVIESVDEDSVHTRCRLLGVGNDLSVHVGGYRDRFVRTADGWRIQFRRFTSHPEGSITASKLAQTS